MMPLAEKRVQEHRRHQHSHRDGQPVGRLHVTRRAEIPDNRQGNRTQQPIHGANVQLALHVTGKFDSEARQQFETHGFMNEREGPRNQRLRRNDGRQRAITMANNRQRVGTIA